MLLELFPYFFLFSILSEFFGASQSTTPSLPSWECYGMAESAEEISYNFEILAVNSTGQQCYQKIDWETIWMFQQEQFFDQGYANAAALLCPSWIGIKTCVSQHVNEKCNKEEKGYLQNAMPLNMEIVIAEVVCEASWNAYFRSLLKKASKIGLWECHASGINECVGKQLQEYNGEWPPFSLFTFQYFQCMKPRFKDCATDEEEMTVLWDKIQNALQKTHDDFWDNLDFK